MPELPSRDPFPRLSALLARRYTYVTEGFIRYRGPGPPEDFELLGLFETERAVFALLAARDTRVPYPARFAPLRESENHHLSGQTDLFVSKAWPQPSVDVAFGRAQRQKRRPGASPIGRTVGRDRPTEPTDVVLRRVGSAQLWWPAGGSSAGKAGEPVSANGHGPAVIWEAFLDIRQEGLLEWLWDCCEAFLSGRGAECALTPSRDPTYESDIYRQFLRRRGYALVFDRAERASRPAGAAWMQKPF